VSDPIYQILEGDCRERLRELPDESIASVICDPPYGIASPSKVVKRGAPASQKSRFEAFDLDWDRVLPLDWIAPAARVLALGGAFLAFTDTKRTGDLWSAMEAAGLRPLQCVYWVKANPPPHPRKNFQSAIEAAVYARKPGASPYWDGGGATPNYMIAPIAGGLDRTAHPTQKPLALMRWLVRLLTPPDGVVLDPFAGSGTTLAAAALEQRSAIGIELSPEYAAIARARLEAWRRTDDARQLPLFGEGKR
tara:strand:+ start:933 stop:1682 length:750 start_codon:yes stop_codon:yes gene_type:complete